MAPPKRKGGGRVTPKGTKPGVPRASQPDPSHALRGDDDHPMASSRYTPPTPKYVRESPPWVPVLMFTLLGLGLVLIVLNYLELLPGAVNNWYLVAGLLLIFGGIVTATQYR